MHAATHQSARRSGGSPALTVCALLAVAVHAAVLFAWRYVPEEPAASAIEGDSIEVSLVESAPAAPAAPPSPPEPQPVVPPPVPEPVPVPKEQPGMTLPTPVKPTPTPPPQKPIARPPSAATPAPNAKPNPRPAVQRPVTSPNATGSGTGTGASATGGAGTGRIARPVFITPPTTLYPPESRAAQEQGTVILRLVVDGTGRPTSVTVARSSGFPRLDRAAVEAGWRCRVRDAAPGARLDAPVRFSLTN